MVEAEQIMDQEQTSEVVAEGYGAGRSGYISLKG